MDGGAARPEHRHRPGLCVVLAPGSAQLASRGGSRDTAPRQVDSGGWRMEGGGASPGPPAVPHSAGLPVVVAFSQDRGMVENSQHPSQASHILLVGGRMEEELLLLPYC